MITCGKSDFKDLHKAKAISRLLLKFYSLSIQYHGFIDVA